MIHKLSTPNYFVSSFSYFPFSYKITLINVAHYPIICQHTKLQTPILNGSLHSTIPTSSVHMTTMSLFFMSMITAEEYFPSQSKNPEAKWEI